MSKKVLVKIDGGLGSQMWQYALGRCVHISSGMPVLYDLSWFDKFGMDANGICSRKYQLEDVFPKIHVRKAGKWTREFYRLVFNKYPGTWYEYDGEMMTSKRRRFLRGYYLNERYISQQGDALRDLFEFKTDLTEGNRRVLSMIESGENPVALHIRRGDYLNSAHDVATPQYFLGAIARMTEMLRGGNATFFVFSNGMDWSRELLGNLEQNFVFVEGNDNDDGVIDMFLMSKCAHFIISNSNFSWWPAWLSRRSQSKIVLMPDKWLHGEKQRLAMRVNGWLALPAE